MKFYIASLFSERESTAALADEITEKLGWTCTATWVYGSEKDMYRRDIAEMDLLDVDKADVLIVVSHLRGTPKPGGGRWVEFGYAMGLGKKCYVIGPYENVFCHHPAITVYPTVQCMIADKERQEND